MIPFARSLSAAGHDSGLLVARLRYRQRGWNGAERSPVEDGRWALDELAGQHPGVPIGLVGHSMGGRTAMYVAGHPAVLSVVGLAPWIESGDPVDALAGRRVLIAHGDLDRMTSPVASAEFARRAASVAAQVTYIAVQGEKHSMLHRASLWHDLATGFSLGALLDLAPNGTAEPIAANAVSKALAGQPSLVV
jgi:dienelactone hydrolase